MKFAVDMPISPSLGLWLSERGHDAVHISKIGMSTAPDSEILKWARKEERIVVTADLDFPRLIALAESDMPPLILFRGGNYSEQGMKKLMERVLKAVAVHDIERSIIVVDRTRIRKVRLPIE